MTQTIKLTSMAKAAGCAAKMAPGTLDAVLRNLPRQSDPNVLVGFSTNDDAGIYLLGQGLALVQTVDFFTPVVDDPFTFGQIAAANSLSDIYAMGGRPISALSIVGFPEKGDPAILEQIMRGGLNKMAEAKCSVIGGHSLRNDDIQFGYAVTGLDRSQPSLAKCRRAAQRRAALQQAVGYRRDLHGAKKGTRIEGICRRSGRLDEPLE